MRPLLHTGHKGLWRWSQTGIDPRRTLDQSKCGLTWNKRLPSLLLLILLFVLHSLLDEGQKLLIWRADTCQNQAGVWRKQADDVPSWEEAETWTRHQHEWKTLLYPSKVIFWGNQNPTKLAKPRILLMGGVFPRDTRAHNSSYTLEFYESFDVQRQVFNKTEDLPKPVPSECVPMASWQTKQFPTCNIVHEFDFGSSVRRDAIYQKKRSNHQTHAMRMKILGNGGMRIAWSAVHRLTYLGHNRTLITPIEQETFSNKIAPTNQTNDHFKDEIRYRKEEVILKTLKWAREYTPRLFEDNRVDALVSERLTSSPYVIDIYGFCGNAVINEMASGDSMDNIVKHNLTSFEVLKLITEASYGIADVHSIDYFQDRAYASGEALLESKVTDALPCNSTVVHNDLGPSNFLVGKDGKMKVSDFNLSVLQYWNKTDDRQCRFYNTHPCGVHGAMASPESCKMAGLTEKIDVYGLGAVIFFALSEGQKPFSFNHFENIESLGGIRSFLVETLWQKGSTESVSLKFDRIRRAITNGVSPQLSSDLERRYHESNETAVRILVQIMKRAMQYRPQDRPTARTIAKELHIALNELSEAEPPAR